MKEYTIGNKTFTQDHLMDLQNSLMIDDIVNPCCDICGRICEEVDGSNYYSSEGMYICMECGEEIENLDFEEEDEDE